MQPDTTDTVVDALPHKTRRGARGRGDEEPVDVSIDAREIGITAHPLELGSVWVDRHDDVAGVSQFPQHDVADVGIVARGSCDGDALTR
jgi:hypothetical protein